MKYVYSTLFLLAYIWPLDAQISGRLSRASNGMTEVRIRNDSAIDVQAFVVTVNQVPESPFSPETPLEMYSDPLIDSTAKPLVPKEERVVLVRGNVMAMRESIPKRSMEEPIRALKEPIIAGILSDASSTGDTVLLSRLILRRCIMLQAAETALEILSDAGKSNASRDQLSEEFKMLTNSVSHWYLPPEQQVGRGVYQSINMKLVNLPRVELGAPFRPSSFVEEETRSLSRLRAALLKLQPALPNAALTRISIP